MALPNGKGVTVEPPCLNGATDFDCHPDLLLLCQPPENYGPSQSTCQAQALPSDPLRLLPGSPTKVRQLFGLAGAGGLIRNHLLPGPEPGAVQYRLHREKPDHHAKPSVGFLLGKGGHEATEQRGVPLAQGVRLCLEGGRNCRRGVFRGMGPVTVAESGSRVKGQGLDGLAEVCPTIHLAIRICPDASRAQGSMGTVSPQGRTVVRVLVRRMHTDAAEQPLNTFLEAGEDGTSLSCHLRRQAVRRSCTSAALGAWITSRSFPFNSSCRSSCSRFRA